LKIVEKYPPPGYGGRNTEEYRGHAQNESLLSLKEAVFIQD
jgi:hypothetical protein